MTNQQQALIRNHMAPDRHHIHIRYAQSTEAASAARLSWR
jgi:hypothetical protein